MNSTTIAPRTDKVVIFQGDDEARINELREAAERAKPDPKAQRLLHEDPEAAYRAACEEHDEYKREAETRAVVLVVQALRRKQWRSLVAEHPPRENNAGDTQLGINLLSFPDALVPASLADPAFDTPADREDFLEQLSDAQFDELFWSAFRLNRGGALDPKDFLASAPSSSKTAS